jgi:hypothetical protein
MLRDLQSAIGATLLADYKAPPPPGLIAGDPARAAARIMIHRGNTVESLIGALGHTYPAVKAVCGDYNFRVLGAAYVRAHPPRRPQLLCYGEAFAAFAAGHSAAIRDFPFLPDLARLEWALNDAYYAADAPALTPAALGAIAPERLPMLCLALHPATRLVASPEHPIHTIWSAVQDSGAPPEQLPPNGETVLVTRPSGPLETHLLGGGEAIFLGTIAAGAPLEKAVAQAAENAPGFDPAAALAAALTRGVFGAEVTFNPTPDGGVL